MQDQYARAVEVIGVRDGDTFNCRLDLGFNVFARYGCRLWGINAPEPDEAGGPEAAAALTRLLASGDVTVRSVRLDLYQGRFLGQVFVSQGRGEQPLDVAIELVKGGFAVPWDGRGPKPMVPWPPIAATAPQQA